MGGHWCTYKLAEEEAQPGAVLLVGPAWKQSFEICFCTVLNAIARADQPESTRMVNV